MKKILVLGSVGMLGHMVYSYLSKIGKYELRDASFPVRLHEGSDLLDTTNRGEVESFIRKVTPDVVINCIGILIGGSSMDPANAIYLNSYLPHQLAKLTKNQGGKLIHISTDCVFSGERGGYKESDFKDARDIYGLSKALGEVINDRDLTFRTSIIGPELKKNGEGLFQWFMNQKGTIRGYTRAYWSGVTTLELARAIDAAIDQGLAGVCHITPAKRISKFDLLTLFKQVWRRDDIEIVPNDAKVSDKSLLCTRSDFAFQVKDYLGMLEDLSAFMKLNRQLYVAPYY